MHTCSDTDLRIWVNDLTGDGHAVRVVRLHELHQFLEAP